MKEKFDYQMIEHQLEPIYDNKSKILILGSLPSVKSREVNFYYGHPQNRFWKILSAIYKVDLLMFSSEEKKQFLLDNNIALWDVIAKCMIKGSSDLSIKDVEPNDLTLILNNAKIEKILVNGSKAYDLYMKYIYPQIKVECVKMPSTSPANATYKLEKLIEIYQGFLKK